MPSHRPYPRHRSVLTLGLAALIAASCARSDEASPAPSPAAAGRNEPTKARDPLPAGPAEGTLVLLVTGNALELEVSAIRPKALAWRASRARSESPYEVVLRDAEGDELGSYPLDLRGHDLDPARTGAPDRVEGDVVTSCRVATLARVPWLADAREILIRKGEAVLGFVSADELDEIVARGKRAQSRVRYVQAPATVRKGEGR